MAKKAAEAKTAESIPAPAPGNLPLFFVQPVMLDKERHAGATVSTEQNYAFARTTNSLTLTLPEFVEAGKYYPIVFTDNDTPAPIAVLGLGQENFFVDAKGDWKEGHYIPAYARQYPFIFFERPEEKNFYLCIDEASPQFKSKKQALPLFTTQGEPTDLTKNALQFCSAYYQDHTTTRAFCADLQKHNLLQPARWELEMPTGQKLGLTQFRAIDEAAFNALPDEVILDFRKKGWLAFIYFSLASTTNWKNIATLGKEKTT